MSREPSPARAATPPAADPLRQACSVLDEAGLRGRPYEMSQALCAVADELRAAGVADAACLVLEQALQWARLAGGTDLVVELLCELCEAGLGDAAAPCSGAAAARRDHVREHAAEAARLAARVADPCWEVAVLLRVSDLLVRLGDHRDAVRLQSRALALMAPRCAAGRCREPGCSAVRRFGPTG